MERKYWLGRSSVAGMMAKKATSAEARLIHLELAGRHSAKADEIPPQARGNEHQQKWK